MNSTFYSISSRNNFYDSDNDSWLYMSENDNDSEHSYHFNDDNLYNDSEESVDFLNSAEKKRYFIFGELYYVDINIINGAQKYNYFMLEGNISKLKKWIKIYNNTYPELKLLETIQLIEDIDLSKNIINKLMDVADIVIDPKDNKLFRVKTTTTKEIKKMLYGIVQKFKQK